jgi:hypothetical protein
MARPPKRWFLLSYLSILLIAYVTANCFVSLTSAHWSSANPSRLGDPLNNFLHIAVASGSEEAVLSSWGSAFLSSNFSGGLRFLKNGSWAAKFAKASVYFFQNTTAKWFVMVTDQAHVYVENLGDFVVELEEGYDPVNEAVILGNCISVSGTVGFLHGGTGWIMSRKAVGDFLAIAGKGADGVNDDRKFAGVMQTMNVSVREATSPYFLGQFRWNDEHQQSAVGDFSKLPKCPDIEQIACKLCKPVLAPVQKVVFLSTQTGVRVPDLSQCPETIHWYMCGNSPHLCRVQ